MGAIGISWSMLGEVACSPLGPGCGLSTSPSSDESACCWGVRELRDIVDVNEVRVRNLN